jgi:hypothetical protein
MERYIDKLPMTIRFVSDLLKIHPDMPQRNLVNRAYELACLVHEKHKNDKHISREKMSHEPRIGRGQTKRGVVENLWTNGVCAKN